MRLLQHPKVCVCPIGWGGELCKHTEGHGDENLEVGRWSTCSAEYRLGATCPSGGWGLGARGEAGLPYSKKHPFPSQEQGQ